MNILHILGSWPPEYGGGVTETTYEIARGQAKSGHAVSVLVGVDSLPDYEVRSTVEDGLTVHRFGVPPYFRHEPEGWWLPHDRALDHEKRVAALIKEVLHSSKAEVMDYHVNRPLGEEALFEADRCGVAVVASLHDFWLICGRLMLFHFPDQTVCDGPGILKCALCLRAGSGASTTFENAKAFARVAFKAPSPWRKLRRRRRAVKIVRAAMARSMYLANAHRRFIDGPCEATLGGIAHPGVVNAPRAPSETIRFGYFGGEQSGKGLEDLVPAVRSLAGHTTKFEIHLFGRINESFGPPFVMRGRFEAADRATAYSSIDVAIVPTRHAEPRGRIPEEGALAGVPSIVADVGGLPETVIDGVSGLLFRPRDQEDLRRQMNRILSEAGLLERLRAGLKAPPNLLDALPAIEKTYRYAIARPAEEISAPSTGR